MNSQNLDLLNSANIILIPKKPDAIKISDYRPISLIHSIAKIFSKLLANRLAPVLDDIVSICQSAFIKRRCIQDNFLYVQNTVKRLQKLKIPALFMKLDIQKAFDTINWSYLLEVLRALGSGERWRQWISMLFGTASSRAMINGQLGDSFIHRRGVRQGDPLSPMLFILAIDPLQRILDMASTNGILTPLPLVSMNLRTSLYADDAAIFITPNRDDLMVVKSILETFGKATGLVTNFDKSSIHPIRCEGIDPQHVLEPFPGACKDFSCRYLGLHTRALQKIHVQPLIEKIRQRLPDWKGQLLNRAGRLTLVTSVLSSMPTYHLTVFPIAVWARKQIDKI
jgi:mannosylglycoprotein endo-beta-mannosidase